MFRSLAVLALALVGAGVGAQIVPADPDWKELDAPPPPPLRTEGLISLDVRGTTLRFGVDPASIAIGEDSVVRYVVVARSDSGTVNAMYEGLRCQTGEVKVYAHHQPSAGWVPARSTDWRPINDNRHARYSLLIARQGACLGHAVNRPASRIARDLASPAEGRFEQR